MTAMWTGLDVFATGLVTPVGLTATATAAAVRAGIVRVRDSELHDQWLNPVRTGFLTDENLAQLDPVRSPVPDAWPPYWRRLVRLAGPALREATVGLDRPVPLFLALPERPPADFLLTLVRQADAPFELANSQVIGGGRAAGLLAVDRAARWLADRRGGGAVVGAVDSYAAVDLLAELEGDERLHVDGPGDGFIPGEGAAFLRVGSPGADAHEHCRPLARITSVGIGHERGHLHSSEPHRADGLSQAFRETFSRAPAAGKVRWVYAGFNGESFWGKEWGVAHIRNADRFSADLRIEHPAENTGDAGAALGPMMLALAALGRQKRYLGGPILVWCGSDHELRVAALLDAAEGGER